MNLNLRMSQWGLAIVSVMLTFELIIFGVLFLQIKQTEREAQGYEHATKIMGSANYLLKLYYDLAMSLVYYMMTHKPELSRQYDQSVSEATKEMEKLRSLAVSDRQASPKVNELCQLMSKSTQYFTEYKDQLDKDEIPDFKEIRKRVVPLLTQMMTKLRLFTEDQEKQARITMSPERAREQRAVMIDAVIAGMVLNIVCAILFMFLFTKFITSRLNVLRVNSYRLASELPLMPLLKGSDEIANVDKVFHDMAFELNEAARKEREAKEAITANEEKVRAIIEHMPVGLIAIDQSGLIESINPRTEQIFGFSQTQLSATHVSKLFADANPSEPEKFMQTLMQRALNRVCELEAKKRDETVFPAEISLTEFQSPEGTRFLVNLLDVTERHEVERLKREFVAIVSHDLRTPLASVLGSLTLLSAGAMGDLPAGALEVVSTAESEIERLTRLVNDLLDIAKIEAGKMEMHFQTTSLASVIKRSIAAVSNFAVQHKIEIEAGETEATALADCERLIQVLVNLLSNAIKFSPEGQRVEVSTAETPGWIEVRVKDYGRGVPDEHKETIFERFQQVEASDATQKGGTGLGLPICKTIVEQHGGTIGVESEPGAGSTFWFRLRSLS